MRHHRSRMPPLSVVAGYVLLVLLWGSTWAAIKVGVSSVPPFVFAFERAVAVSAVLKILSFALGLSFPLDRSMMLAAAFVGVVIPVSIRASCVWSGHGVASGL